MFPSTRSLYYKILHCITGTTVLQITTGITEYCFVLQPPRGGPGAALEQSRADGAVVVAAGVVVVVAAVAPAAAVCVRCFS